MKPLLLTCGISAWVAFSFLTITGTTGEKEDPGNLLLIWDIPVNFLINSASDLTLRYINSNLTLGAAAASGSISAYKAGTAVAADVSLTYKNVAANQEGWTFGFVLSNLGTKIGYTNDATQKEFIPANMGLGGNYTKVFDEQNKISFGLDLNKLLVPAPPVPANGADTVSTAALQRILQPKCGKQLVQVL